MKSRSILHPSNPAKNFIPGTWSLSSSSSFSQQQIHAAGRGAGKVNRISSRRPMYRSNASERIQVCAIEGKHLDPGTMDRIPYLRSLFRRFIAVHPGKNFAQRQRTGTNLISARATHLPNFGSA